MNSGFSYEYQPNAANTAAYQKLYEKYLKLGKFTEEQLFK
jgi:L-ribulokinase